MSNNNPLGLSDFTALTEDIIDKLNNAVQHLLVASAILDNEGMFPEQLEIVDDAIDRVGAIISALKP